MSVLTNISPLALWQDVIKTAEGRCSVTLKYELEKYLVELVIRYTNKPELAKQILATAYLEAMQQKHTVRAVSLQHVGDQCLIFSGLFPKQAETRHVKLSYFVDLGRSAYSAVSQETNDLYASLSVQFVLLMDVLQSIRSPNDMAPLEAYAQWHDLGSRRAFNILKDYTKATPYKRYS